MTPASAVPAAEPILSIEAASDIDANGLPVAPAHIFAPDAPQITVVVHIGDVDPHSSLEIVWSMYDGTVKTALFTHTIPVSSNDVAYSRGLSPGVLLDGRYDIDIALGENRVRTSVMVLQPTSASGIVRVDATPLPTVTTEAPPLPDPPPGPQPPVSGESGVEHPPSAPAPTSAGCQLTLTGDGNLSATMDTTGCAGDTIVGAAGADNGALTIIDPSLHGDTLRFWSVDPCKVGASDLPESGLRYAAEIVSGPDKGLRREVSGTVPKDSSPPLISFISTPEESGLAIEGSQIKIDAEAMDVRAGGPGASGIAAIKFRDFHGNTLQQSHFDGPTSCDKSRLDKQASLSYTVPQNPPPILTLTMEATDFAGNTESVVASFITVAEWKGLLVAKTSAVVPGATCAQTWQVIVSITVTNGIVSGTGDATPNGPTSCPLAGDVATSHETCSITGSFDGRAFHIQFELTGGGGYDTGLHVLWFPKPVTIDVPWEPSHRGSADVNIFNDEGELSGVPASASLDGWIQLLLQHPSG